MDCLVPDPSSQRCSNEQVVDDCSGWHAGEARTSPHIDTPLEDVFAHADAFQSHLRDPCAVDLAIFFHDVVYNPRAAGGKNEDDSAVLFSNFAQEVNLEPATLAKVFRWIVLTKHHRCDESDYDDRKFFVDFDLAVLGWERAASPRYAQDVRKEFIHVPEGQREGRRGAHNGQKTPPDVGVIMIIIQNGQSLSPVLNRGASMEWTKTCLVRASVRLSVHSLLFTLYPLRCIAYFFVSTHWPLLLTFHSSLLTLHPSLFTSSPLLSFTSSLLHFFTSSLLHFFHYFTSSFLHFFTPPGSQSERALRSARK